MRGHALIGLLTQPLKTLKLSVADAISFQQLM
jgi:hypothetical protein